MTDLPPRSDSHAGRRRWAVLVGAATLVLSVVAVVAVAIERDETDETHGSPAPVATIATIPTVASGTRAPDVTLRPATSTDSASSSSGRVAPVTSELPAATSAPVVSEPLEQRSPVSPEPVVPPSTDAPSGGELSPSEVPGGTIPGDDPVEVCNAIIDRLETYRSIAVEAPVSSIHALLPALEAFELDIFTAADLQDWGDRIIEQLVNVRREWSTALSASELQDSAEALRRARAAIEFLDAAIAVPCPR